MHRSACTKMPQLFLRQGCLPTARLGSCPKAREASRHISRQPGTESPVMEITEELPLDAEKGNMGAK